MKTLLLRLLAPVLLMLNAAFGQGLYTESTTSGGPLGDRVMKGLSYYMPRMIKAVSDDEGNAMVFRMDRQVVYEVHPKDKTYSETSFAEWETKMKGLNSKMDVRMAEMQKRMESMPEEQQKMMEQMMGGRMAGAASKEAKMDVIKTGEQRSVAGYTCTKYSVTEDGKEVLAVWATKDVKGFDAMKKDYEEFSRRFMAVNIRSARSMTEAIKKIEGFPMEMDFAEGMKTVVTKAEPKAISQSEFEVPSGFTKVKSKLTEAEEKEKGNE